MINYDELIMTSSVIINRREFGVYDIDWHVRTKTGATIAWSTSNVPLAYDLHYMDQFELDHQFDQDLQATDEWFQKRGLGKRVEIENFLLTPKPTHVVDTLEVTVNRGRTALDNLMSSKNSRTRKQKN